MAARRKKTKARTSPTTRKKPATAKKKTATAKKKTAAAKKKVPTGKKKAAAKAARKPPARPARKAAAKAAAKRPAARKRAAPGWGLALLGDWNRGAFLAGALDRLRRTGKLPDVRVVAGSGSGALVAALAALGRWQEMRKIFGELDRHRLLCPRHAWLPGGRAASFLLSSVTHTQSLFLTRDGLQALVREQVDAAALREAPWEVHFVATDLQTGAIRSFNTRLDSPEDLSAGLLAAASRPILMPLVRAGYERHQYTEGALRGYAPLAVLFEALARGEGAGAAVERILAISTLSPIASHRLEAYRDIGDVLDRTAELLAGKTAKSDLRAATLINALLGLRDQLGEKRFLALLGKLDDGTRAEVERHLAKRRVPLIHLHPDAPPGAGALDCEPAASRAAFDSGAAAAERVFG